MGDQYLLRDGAVLRLNGESDEIEPFAESLAIFLDAASSDAVGYLALGPLVAFREQGGVLAPGQFLSVFPPLIVKSDASGYSYRAVSALDLLGAHASLAAQLRDLPDGTPVRITTSREE